MPELPEVETVRRQLDDRLRGKTIREITIFKTGREKPAGLKFKKALLNKKIERIDRRAKVLIWRFNGGEAIVAHLKMTGSFVFVPVDHKPKKHDRIRFQFSDVSEFLVWADIRQFGFMQFMSTQELNHVLSKYGPEPLETEAKILAERLKSPATRTVKAALLDQHTIAGIGNIYADETLHRAGIRPTRRLKSITATERLRLCHEIKHVLAESLAQQGTSANDYVDTRGERGGFLDFLRVYGRAGEPCLSCGQPIKKSVLNQRGTHFCAKCQA